MREKEKKRMWPQSSPAAMGSFTLGAGAAGEGWSGAPAAPQAPSGPPAPPISLGVLGRAQAKSWL